MPSGAAGGAVHGFGRRRWDDWRGRCRRTHRAKRKAACRTRVRAARGREVHTAIAARRAALGLNGGGLELSAVVDIGSVDTIVRFEGATTLEITPDAPDRMLEHF